MIDCSINGIIRRLQLFRPRGEPHDLLFVLTDINDYFVLKWHPLTSEIVTRFLFAGLGYLVYLEIGVGVLNEVKYETIKYDVSCLDISPIGEDPDSIQIAAVGVWTDTSVRIYSLCKLEGVYLLVDALYLTM